MRSSTSRPRCELREAQAGRWAGVGLPAGRRERPARAAPPLTTVSRCPCRYSVTAQANYEKSVFAKTSRTNARGEGAPACRWAARLNCRRSGSAQQDIGLARQATAAHVLQPCPRSGFACYRVAQGTGPSPTTHPLVLHLPLHVLASLSCRPAAEIIMFDDVVVVYKFLGDLMFYVTGDQDENEVRH